MDDELLIPEGLVAGVDEAGRGPLAGPVVAGAVILDPSNPIEGLQDSKRLSAAKREALYEEIQNKALAWAVGHADVGEIDRINILQATMLAMQRAVEALRPAAEHALIDGNRCPALDCPAQAIITGNGVTGPAVPRLRTGATQGLSQQGAYRGAGESGGDADSPAFLCAGQAGNGKTGGIISGVDSHGFQ